jgi:hypothetical protein
MGIEPKNLSAQQTHRARGNPPSTTPETAISNCFPGLEFDIRNFWKNIFEGIELHEAGLGSHWVVGVDATGTAAGVQLFDQLLAVDGHPVEQVRITPSGPAPDRRNALEFFNALADVVAKSGQEATCRFRRQDQGGTVSEVSVALRVRTLFEGPAIAEALAEPGALTQSLCSPWQADYRECGCFYWAASRPDYVEAEDEQGAPGRFQWLQRDRDATVGYRSDNGSQGGRHVTYEDLYREWERVLRFVIGGREQE